MFVLKNIVFREYYEKITCQNFVFYVSFGAVFDDEWHYLKVNVLRIVGFHDGVLSRWVVAWAISWAIAFPTVFVIMPIARKVVGLFVEMPPTA